MRYVALTLDLLLFPLRVICWPFVVVNERLLDPANRWIRATWRRGDG